MDHSGIFPKVYSSSVHDEPCFSGSEMNRLLSGRKKALSCALSFGGSDGVLEAFARGELFCSDARGPSTGYSISFLLQGRVFHLGVSRKERRFFIFGIP